MSLLSTGEAAGLAARSLLGLVELNMAETYEAQHPVQQLYLDQNGGRFEVLPYRRFEVEFLRHVRERGEWLSRMSKGKPVKRERYGKAASTIPVQLYEEDIDYELLATMRDIGSEPEQPFMINAAADARRRGMEAGLRVSRGATELASREAEVVACKMLSSNTFTITIDGDTSPALSTGLGTLNTVAASWATESTDIVLSRTKMLEEFIEQAGGPPTHEICSFRLRQYYAKNTGLKAIFNAPRGDNIAMFPNIVQPMDFESLTKIEHTGIYHDSSGTVVDFWPQNVVTWLRLPPGRGRDVIRPVTYPLPQNSFGDGPMAAFDAWIAEHADRRATAYVAFIGWFMNLDTTQIRAWDVTTT